MLLDAPSKPPPVSDPEALIEEARHRQRRRRRGIALVLLVVAAAGVAAFEVFGRSSSPAIERVPNGPVVNVRALSGHGRLAFVSRNVLYAVSGPHVRRLPNAAGSFVPLDPQLSPDGKWLAYIEASLNGVAPNQLWLADGDGTDARRIDGVAIPATIVGWQPGHDVLAITSKPMRPVAKCPCDSATTIRLVSPNGSSRVIARVPWIYGAAWSPDGDAIAFGDEGRLLNRVATVPAAGGTPTVWIGPTRTVLQVAGWWKSGVGAWLFPFGSVRNMDGTQLVLLPRAGAQPVAIGETLSSEVVDSVSANVNGALAIERTGDGGRSAWSDKNLALCSATVCRMQPVPGHVTVDPAWSPDGRTLVYATAPEHDWGMYFQKRVATWFAQHRAYLSGLDGPSHALPAADGGTSFTWSPDGRSLLFVKDDGLWLLPKLGGAAVQIASPLFPRNDWTQYYAQVPWAQQFSWAG